jgi:hypothetical protein
LTSLRGDWRFPFLFLFFLGKRAKGEGFFIECRW